MSFDPHQYARQTLIRHAQTYADQAGSTPEGKGCVVTRKQEPTISNRLWAVFCMVVGHRAGTAHTAAQRTHPRCARCDAEMKPSSSR